jgi:hypothetical protein
MANTTNLQLPLIDQNQSQKAVTHNVALASLDAIVHLAVIDDGLAAPPGTPADGDRYIVAPSASGAWAGKDLQIAAWQNGAWSFYAPRSGWLAFVMSKSEAHLWTGASWVPLASVIGALANLAGLGILTTADATNRLAVKSNAALFSHDDVTPGTGDMRIAVNKSAAAKDAGFVFQDAFSTRALFGLLGDDDFTLKVSPDGSVFKTAFTVDKAAGKVSFDEHSKFSAFVNFDKYIPAAAWTNFQPNNTRHNDQGDYDTGANRFTAPHAGYFLFGAGYRFKANAAIPDDIRVGLSVNSASPAADATATAGDATITTLQSFVQATALLKLAAGDTIEAMAFMTTNDGYVEANSNFFWGAQIA